MLFSDLTEVLDPEPHDAALNMAIDEVLLRNATGPLLRVYRWAQPAVSFGYFLKYEEVAAEARGRDLVRRWTGGGVVPHGGDVTYSLIVPRSCAVFEMTASQSYEAIHRCLASLLGDEANLASAPAEKVSEKCFENAAQHDLLVSGGKVAGGAQRRTKFGMLHQGSIHLPSSGEWLRSKLREVFVEKGTTRNLSAAEIQEATALAAERYSTDAWTRRF